MKILILTTLIVSSMSALASPYDNLAHALNEQVMIKDLRTHCDIPPTVPDEKVKSVFLNSQINHQSLSAAGSALKDGRHDQYQTSIESIRCPTFVKQ
ncbi:YicS family protein [Pantoea sp. EA-12]|uniref:YicS family protein n=1 Tax=Pantoea sp. EA-12 TaxID=3043303 RepID=UPI0024B5FCC3|nr:YicS family protein [Pantoea sp. EA-12]MDI9221536.1 YicS family protein [Pantoea sp. EA-12]